MRHWNCKAMILATVALTTGYAHVHAAPPSEESGWGNETGRLVILCNNQAIPNNGYAPLGHELTYKWEWPDGSGFGNDDTHTEIVKYTVFWENMPGLNVTVMGSTCQTNWTPPAPGTIDYHAYARIIYDPVAEGELNQERDTPTDSKTINVVGVKKVEWVGVDPGDGKTNLTADNPSSHGGGHRLFAEKNVGGTLGKNHNTVKVRASLGKTAPNIAVSFAVVDADDPTDSDGPIDNDGGTPGNDNFGGAATLSAASAISDANGVAEVVLTVGTKPGDNYRVIASTKDTALNGIKAKQPDAGGSILDASGATVPDDDSAEAIRKASPLLTVWRKLHLHLASLDSGTDLSYSNKNIDDVVNPPGNDPTHGGDGKCELNGLEPNDDGRFEGGKLKVAGGGTYDVIDNEDATGDDFVWTSAAIAAGDEDKKADLVDDDGSNLPRKADLSLANEKFKNAFIEVVDTREALQLLPFVATSLDSEATASSFYQAMSPNPTEAAYWAAKVMSIHQGKESSEAEGNKSAVDLDPDLLYHIDFKNNQPVASKNGDLAGLFGFTPAGASKPNISLICLETIRDYGAQSAAELLPHSYRQTQANLEKVTVAHELGHQFGLGHTADSLMEVGVIDPAKNIAEADIKVIRQSTQIED